jgi:rhodanese-related sulfurtransferase
MRTSILAVVCLLCLIISPASMSYDEAGAQQYQALFAPFADAKVPKALARIPVEKLVESVRAGEDLVLLDIRTPAENLIVGLTHENTLFIPMNKVFEPENLARIPTDKKVIVVCHKGLRAALIALTLRDIGFGNVYSLKGGLQALAKYVSCKTAFGPPAKKPAK